MIFMEYKGLPRRPGLVALLYSIGVLQAIKCLWFGDRKVGEKMAKSDLGGAFEGI